MMQLASYKTINIQALTMMQLASHKTLNTRGGGRQAEGTNM